MSEAHFNAIRDRLFDIMRHKPGADQFFDTTTIYPCRVPTAWSKIFECGHRLAGDGSDIPGECPKCRGSAV